MMAKIGEIEFMDGAEAIAEAAIQAGCRFYAGYPITPATPVQEYMSKHLPEAGGVHINAASEIEAIGMVWGAAITGHRAMTATSSTAFSLMQEYCAYIGEHAVPVVIVNVCRMPIQGDYFQATRGGGHGDYRMVVLSPASVQECADLTKLAFYLAQKWRMGVLIMADTGTAHLSETVEFKEFVEPPLPPKEEWIVGAVKWRRENQQKKDLEAMFGEHAKTAAMGLHAGAEHLGDPQTRHSKEKYERIAAEEVRFEAYGCEDADYIICAFGTGARYARAAVDQFRAEGLRVGIFRPITLWPYPTEALRKLAAGKKKVLVYELNFGQMVDDVRIAVEGRAPVVSVSDIGTQIIGFGRIHPADVVTTMLREAIQAGELVSA